MKIKHCFLLKTTLFILYLSGSWPVLSQQLFISVLSHIPQKEYSRIETSRPFGELIEQVLVKPDSENVHRLCQALLEDSKPIPALMIAERFQQANMAGNGMKGQAEEGKKLQATIKLIREQIDKLNVDFLKNQALAKRGNLSASIEMAVILYRSGFNRKAIQLLNRELDGKEKHIGCIRTKQAFFLENRLNTQAFLILKKDFNRSLQNRDSKNALKKCAQLCYLAIYGEKPLDELSLYNEFFPGVIDRHMLSLFVNICNYHKQIDRFFRSLN